MTVLTVWDNEKPVGLTRVLDDTAMQSGFVTIEITSIF